MAQDNNPGKRREPFPAYYFQVDLRVDNKTHNTFLFKSCSGLKSESSVVELEEGGFNGTTRKLIGRTKFPNIILKQGFASMELWKLRDKYMNDTLSNQSLSSSFVAPMRIFGIITQKGPNGTLAKWAFEGGWICKWEGPEFDASKNEVSVETIEIAHEGLYMVEVK